MRARLLFALVVLLGAEPALARHGLVEVEMMCPILKVGQKDGVLHVVVGRGRDHGLETGSRGNIYAPGEKSGVSGVVGRGEVVELGPTAAVVRVLPEKGTQPARIKVGGQVEVRAMLPAGVHRGILFDLFLVGVVFLDNYKKPLVDPKALLTARTDAVEQAALARMVTCGHEVIEFTSGFKKPITRGKWKGKVMADVLKQSGPADYVSFLRFVRDFPGKYIGTPWKISETYATWILNNCPPAHEDEVAELRALPAKELARTFKEMKLKDALNVFEFVRKRTAEYPVKRLAEAWKEAELLERLAKARKPLEPALLAELELCRAQILNATPKKKLDAAKAYGRAAAAYFKAGEGHDGIVQLNNVAHCYYEAERYDDALREVAKVRAAVAAELQKTTNPQLAAHLPLREAFAITIEANIANRRGQYQKVVDSLTPIADRYAQVGYPGARQRTIDLLAYVAKAYRKLGKPEEAAKVYARMQQVAGELGDSLRQATIAWDIGDAFFDAGQYAKSLDEYRRAADLATRAGSKSETARALSAMGQAYWNLGKRKEAMAAHDEAMKLREETGERSGIAWQLVQVAKIRGEMGERDAARDLFERAVAIRRDLGQRGAEADVHMELGWLYLDLSQATKAEKEFATARDTYAALKQPSDQARSLRAIGRTHVARHDYGAAAGFVRQAIAIHESLKDRAELPDAYEWLGRLLSAAGDRVAGNAALERGLGLAKRDSGDRADLLLALAWNDVSDGKLDAARRRASEALAIAEKNADVARQMRVLPALATTDSQSGLFDAALARYEKVVALARKAGNRPALVDGLRQKSWSLVELGRLAEGRRAAEEAVPLTEQNSDPVQKAWMLNSLANVQHALGDLREVMRLYDEAIPLTRKAGDRYSEAAITFNRSLLLVELRDLDGALAENHRAQELAKGVSTAELEIALLASRGQTLGLKKQYAEAQRALGAGLAKARTAAPQRVPGLLTQLGRVQAKAGDYPHALKTLDEAVAIERTRPGLQYGALAELGKTQVLAGDARAEATLGEALRLADKRGGSVPWEMLYYLGLVSSRAGRSDQALAQLERSVKEIDRGEVLLKGDRDLAQYRADKLDVYKLLIKLLLQKGRGNDALRYLERSKLGELKEVSRRAGSGADADAAAGAELDAQEAQIQDLLDAERAQAQPDQAKVRKLEALLDDIGRRRTAFIDKLMRQGSRLFDEYSLKPLGLEKLQKFVPAGTVLISPVVLDDRVVVFAVTSKVITHVETPGTPAEVEKLVTAVLAETDPQKLAKQKAPEVEASLKRLRGPSRRLYDLLVRPVFAAVGQPRVLAVSASGLLRYLPFAVLSDGDTFLVEKTALVSVSFLGSYEFAKGEPLKGTPRVLIFADPDGTLPAARAEAEGIKAVLARSTAFVGKAATQAELRAETRHGAGYDIVHLATHGFLDAKNPERSSILLADRSLAYPDIPTLDLRKSRLIVLSACATAARARGSGIEIAGLASQFERAKVGSVMATLWPVNDQATADLMRTFYEEVSHGKGIAESLALSQRHLLAGQNATYRHPAFWGPFVLMGSP